jgi:hypothetical protein
MEYLNILKEINYLSYLGAFIKWIFLFLVISVILLIIANKYKLFQRKNRTVNILVKVWLIFIPIWFLIFALQFAPVRNTQKEFNRLIVKHKDATAEFVYTFMGKVVSDSLLVQEASVESIVDNYLDTSVSKESPDEGKGFKKARRFVTNVKRNIEYNFLSRILETKMLEGASAYVGMDKHIGKAIYQTSFNDLFKEGEIVSIFKTEVNYIFGILYKSMFIAFLIGLMVPIIEIIFSKVFKY